MLYKLVIDSVKLNWTINSHRKDRASHSKRFKNSLRVNGYRVMVIEYTVIEYTVNLIVRPSKIQEIRKVFYREK